MSNDDYFDLLTGKFLVVLAQLRQVPPVKWSHKTAIKNQNDRSCRCNLSD
jgi:hypothetical protein